MNKPEQERQIMTTSKLKRQIKNNLKKILSSPLGKPLMWPYRGKTTTLMYHRLINHAKEICPLHYNLCLCVTTEQFNQQIRYISENYHCLDMDSFYQGLHNNNLPNNSILVTFDDGYRDNITLGLPILKKYNVPATIFVSTDFVERRGLMWWYEQEEIIHRYDKLAFEFENRAFSWSLRNRTEKEQALNDLYEIFVRMDLPRQRKFMKKCCEAVNYHFDYDDLILSWEEIEKFDNEPLITFAAHTLGHPVLSQTSEIDLTNELYQSKTILEDHLNHPVNYFAYPYGEKLHASQREFEAAKKVGFKCAFTTRWGHIHRQHKDYAHCLPRMAIDYQDTMSEFIFKLSGSLVMVAQRGKRFITD